MNYRRFGNKEVSQFAQMVRKYLLRQKNGLTWVPGDAGASPWKACALAAIRSLDDRASAPEPSVSRAAIEAIF